MLTAAFSAVTFVIQFQNDEWPLVALFSAWALCGLLIWEVIDYHLRPKPDVRFRKYSHVDKHSVYFKTTTDGKETIEVKSGDFRRLAFTNVAADPSGDASTAKQLSARITVRDVRNTIADAWDGRWADFEEINTPAKKWQSDQIDLPANAKDVVLDVVMRYCGGTVVMGWDNSLSAGLGPRPALRDPKYTVEVCLNAGNMKERGWFFELVNTAESFDLVLLAAESSKVVSLAVRTPRRAGSRTGSVS